MSLSSVTGNKSVEERRCHSYGGAWR